MKSGQDCLNLAQSKIGQKYVFGVDVPTNDPSWNGPWDCAEFVTWVVYQVSGKLYGCVDNHNPVNCDAYTGAWARDVKSSLVQSVPLEEAKATPGGILLRYSGKSGHIVFADGHGRTVEAMFHGQGGLPGAMRRAGLGLWDLDSRFGIYSWSGAGPGEIRRASHCPGRRYSHGL
jgi:N-acetylmuramoyl-L-alanine amidase